MLLSIDRCVAAPLVDRHLACRLQPPTERPLAAGRPPVSHPSTSGPAVRHYDAWSWGRSLQVGQGGRIVDNEMISGKCDFIFPHCSAQVFLNENEKKLACAVEHIHTGLLLQHAGNNRGKEK